MSVDYVSHSPPLHATRLTGTATAKHNKQNEDMIDHRNYTHNLTSCEIKA